MTAWLAILAVGLAAGVLGGVVGFGASVVMVPILSIAFGPKDAIPIMAIASLMANASRVLVWWREVDWRSALSFAAVAAPASAIGARTMLALDAARVETVLGAFLLAVAIARRTLRGRGFALVKGAFIGTEAAASVAVYGAKLAVFGANGIYTADAVGRGLLVGLSLMGGAWIAKRIVVGMSAARFGALMDLLLAGAGLTMLARGIGAG